MPKLLTDGKIKFGGYTFPDRKKTALCIEEGNSIVVYGYFGSVEQANEFIERIAKMLGAEGEQPAEGE